MPSSFLRSLFRVRAYLMCGALLIMAGSLLASPGFYGFTLNSIDGKPAPLADYKGKVILVVNVASQCGYTPQYSALESTYEKYKDQGFVILGFPANILARRSRERTKKSKPSAPANTA
jgi:glutathione peroxidase